jgi:glyoxylase-like metal-dependent hydrolase (beta-lactamase superfamily II)
VPEPTVPGVSVDAGTPPGHDDGSTTPDGSGSTGIPDGDLNVTWMHGSANCNTNQDPEVQVHAYNATTYIIRQNKCDTFEAPFVYVLVGTDRALLLDSGDTTSTALRATVQGLIGGKPLLVAHTHAHSDHTRGDTTFAGQPNTTVVAKSISAIQQTFQIATWPTSQGELDLGGRVLDALGIPGHEAQHIALYDRQTGLLLTGDTLYPGLLFISDWTAYRDSVHRLAQFASTRTILHVMGAHIEMTSTPKQNYPYGTTYQPAEHVLQLTAAHLAELDTALQALGPTPPNGPVAHDDFVIDPQ